MRKVLTIGAVIVFIVGMLAFAIFGDRLTGNNWGAIIFGLGWGCCAIYLADKIISYLIKKVDNIIDKVEGK